MARCDEGYLCQVCGREVKRLIDSSLYLQYVLGWIDSDQLQQTPDIHLRCNAGLSQFIDLPDRFEPMIADGEFDRRRLDPEYADGRTKLVTKGYLRLLQLQRNRSLSLAEYPLQESDRVD